MLTTRNTGSSTAAQDKPLIAHIIFRLDVGGLENGLVNLINNMPDDRYRHAIICLDTYTNFSQRIRPGRAEIYALGKNPGNDPGMYWRLFRLLRQLRPAIVHTRNLGTLDCQFVAMIAGVSARIHGEHGWDVVDLHGTHIRYNILRRTCRLFVHRYIPMSQHLEHWLETTIRVPTRKISQIYNGVDTGNFSPATDKHAGLPDAKMFPRGGLVIGYVGRLEAVKNPLGVVRAFRELLRDQPDDQSNASLVLVGDGPLRPQVEHEIAALGLLERVVLTGPRNDVPDLLRQFDIFVLPSLNEGISNTILEAMATGLPVVATRVGGNPELVTDGITGQLCRPDEPTAMALALRRYATDGDLRRRHGQAGRDRVEKEFSLDAMVSHYLSVYDEFSNRAGEQSGSGTS